MDRSLREAERSGDAAAVLRHRLRVGELTQEHVELAASLGHAAALEVCPDVELVDWAIDEEETLDALRTEPIRRAGSLLADRTLAVRVAADWAERVLPVFERGRPQDSRSRIAIQAARAWVADPLDEERYTTAIDAGNAAFEANNREPYEPDADSAARAAGSAGACAHHPDAPDDIANALFNASQASSAAADAALASGQPDAEREWQRLRLAAYVLGEVETDEPAA